MRIQLDFRKWVKGKNDDFGNSGLEFSAVENYLDSRPTRVLASVRYPIDRHEVPSEWWSGSVQWTYEILDRKFCLLAIDNHERNIAKEGVFTTLFECREFAEERSHGVLLDWLQYLEEEIKNELGHLQKIATSMEGQGLMEDLQKALKLVQRKVSGLRRVGRPTTLPEPWRSLAGRFGSVQRLAESLGTSMGTVRRWAKMERTPRGSARKLIEQLFKNAGLESPLKPE